MADNVTFESGTARVPVGTIIAADDVGGGVVIQRVKLAWGPDGTATDVNSLTATALPVFLANAAAVGGGTGLVSLTGSIIDNVNNAVRVNIVTGGGSGGTAQADESAFTYGTTNLTPIGATIAADSITGSVVGAVRMTTARGLHSHIVGATGNGVVVQAAGSGISSSANRLIVSSTFDNALNSAATLTAASTPRDILPTGQEAIITFQITGVWAGDVFFEGTVDNATYVPIDALPASGNTYVNQTTANGLWVINSSGYSNIQLRGSISSGTAVINYSTVFGGNVRPPAAAGGSGGTAQADESAFTYGTTSFTPIGATIAADSITGSTAGALRMTTARGLHSHLVDETGVSINSAPIGIDQDVGLLVQMQQDIEISANNSSTANVGAGGNFTGTSDPTLGVAAIQVCLFADQNCTVQVQQAQEDPGTNWNIVDSWTYSASSTGSDAARTIQAMASSFRVVVTNDAGSPTTVFRLQSIACPIADSLPRGLTQAGNLRVAIQEAVTLNAQLTAPVSLTGTLSVQVVSMPAVSLTGSVQVSGITNPITVNSHLVSLTGTVSVQIVSSVALSITGSVQISGITNAITVNSHLVSLTGSIQVSGITAPISITGTVTAEQRYAAPATSKLTRINISFSTSASSTLLAGVGGQTIRVHRILFTSSAATTAQFESSTSAISGEMNFAANGALVLDNDGEPWYVTSTADPLRLHITTASQISGNLWYTQS
jgi:hypothetical protein